MSALTRELVAAQPAAAAVAGQRGLAFVALPQAPRGAAWLSKRTLDLLVACLLLLACLPVFAVIAALIRLDSPGPVIIRQQRIGRRLRPFSFYKFRSMIAYAERLQAELLEHNEAGNVLFKIRDDPRITRVGRFLRRFSLDELPQLLNVLRGEMSLVGPRPPFESEVEEDYLRQAIRLRFLPGMTGLWQVSGRSQLDYDAMVRLDLRYTRTWSIWLDCMILLRTIPVVLGGRGAC